MVLYWLELSSTTSWGHETRHFGVFFCVLLREKLRDVTSLPCLSSVIDILVLMKQLAPRDHTPVVIPLLYYSTVAIAVEKMTLCAMPEKHV